MLLLHEDLVCKSLDITTLVIYFWLNYILKVEINAIVDRCGIFDKGVSATSDNLSIILHQILGTAKIRYILNLYN